MTSVTTLKSGVETPLPPGAEEELAGPPHSVTPVKRAERISSLDTLRGFALLGILMLNINDFSGPEAMHDLPVGTAIPPFVGPHAHLNLAVLFLKWIFFEGKMRALFSMLFGAGAILLIDRAERRGAGSQAADIYQRRNLWLVLFGLLHGTFLWTGDILFSYGVCGVAFLYPCRKLKTKTAFIAGTIIVQVFSAAIYTQALQGFSDLSMSRKIAIIAEDRREGKPLTPEQKQLQKQWDDRVAASQIDPQKTQKQLSEGRQGYFAFLKNEGWGYLASEFTPFTFGNYVEVLGNMLIGMALFKSGFFTAELPYATYLGTVALGFLISIPLYIVGIWKAYASGFYFLTVTKWVFLTYFPAQEAGALAIAAVLLLLIKSGAFRPLLRPFAAVGQTALSNYLFTSLLCQLIFRWGPWKLYGALEYYQLLYVVFAVWAVNLTASPLWLSAFEFGPIEWLWRSLTYWKPQPMRIRA